MRSGCSLSLSVILTTDQQKKQARIIHGEIINTAHHRTREAIELESVTVCLPVVVTVLRILWLTFFWTGGKTKPFSVFLGKLLRISHFNSKRFCQQNEFHEISL